MYFFSSDRLLSYYFQGLYYTGNNSADLAAAWIFENQDKDLDAPLEVSQKHNLVIKIVNNINHLIKYHL